MSDEKKWFSPAEAADFLEISKSTLCKRRDDGNGPEFVVIGDGRVIKYSLEALQRYLIARTFTSRHQYQ